MARTFADTPDKLLMASNIADYPITMLCRAYPTDVTANDVYMSNADDADGSIRNLLRLKGDTTNDPWEIFNRRISSDTATAAIISANVDTWQAVGAVNPTNTDRDIWFDGSNTNESTTVDNGGTWDRLGVGGASHSGGSGHINGSIAEAAFFNQGLTDDEMKAAQQWSPLLVRPAALIHWFPLGGLYPDDNYDLMTGVAATVEGSPTSKQHPNVIYPCDTGLIIPNVTGPITAALTESIALSQAAINTATLRPSLSETIDLAQAVVDAMTFRPSVTETIDLAEAKAGALICVRSVTENIDLLQAAINTAIFRPTVLENIDLLQTAIDTATFRPSVTENIDLLEAKTRVAIYRKSLTETIDLTQVAAANLIAGLITGALTATIDLDDAFAARTILRSAIVESIAVNDADTTIAMLVASLAQDLGLTGNFTANRIAIAAYTDALILGETWASRADLKAALNDDIVLNDVLAGNLGDVVPAAMVANTVLANTFVAALQAIASQNENIDLISAFTNVLIGVVTLASNVELSDLLAASASYAASITENVVLGDVYSVGGLADSHLIAAIEIKAMVDAAIEIKPMLKDAGISVKNLIKGSTSVN